MPGAATTPRQSISCSGTPCSLKVLMPIAGTGCGAEIASALSRPAAISAANSWWLLTPTVSLSRSTAGIDSPPPA